MLLIFRAANGYRYHNDQTVSDLNGGKPAKDGDILDIPDQHAKYLLNALPDNWLVYEDFARGIEEEANKKKEAAKKKLEKATGKKAVETAPDKMVKRGRPKQETKDEPDF